MTTELSRTVTFREGDTIQVVSQRESQSGPMNVGMFVQVDGCEGLIIAELPVLDEFIEVLAMARAHAVAQL